MFVLFTIISHIVRSLFHCIIYYYIRYISEFSVQSDQKPNRKDILHCLGFCKPSHLSFHYFIVQLFISIIIFYQCHKEKNEQNQYKKITLNKKRMNINAREQGMAKGLWQQEPKIHELFIAVHCKQVIYTQSKGNKSHIQKC